LQNGASFLGKLFELLLLHRLDLAGKPSDLSIKGAENIEKVEFIHGVLWGHQKIGFAGLQGFVGSTGRHAVCFKRFNYEYENQQEISFPAGQ
jgi:hypothetical protein